VVFTVLALTVAGWSYISVSSRFLHLLVRPPGLCGAAPSAPVGNSSGVSAGGVGLLQREFAAGAMVSAVPAEDRTVSVQMLAKERDGPSASSPAGSPLEEPWIWVDLQNHRITESQNSRGWKGPLWVI